MPSARSPDGADSSSSTFSGVSSSGGEVLGDRGALARRPPRCRYGPYRPTRTTTPSSPIGIELTPRASISSSRVGDQPLQPALRRDALRVRSTSGRRRSRTGAASRPATRSPLAIVVQVVLDRGGEAVVDQPGEVRLQQPDHRERRPGRDERRALLPDVAAVLDRLHDRGVGGRAADAELLHRLDQRRLGVARRRRGACARSASNSRAVERVAAGQLRQPLLGVVLLGRLSSMSST